MSIVHIFHFKPFLQRVDVFPHYVKALMSGCVNSLKGFLSFRFIGTYTYFQFRFLAQSISSCEQSQKTGISYVRVGPQENAKPFSLSHILNGEIRVGQQLFLYTPQWYGMCQFDK